MFPPTTGLQKCQPVVYVLQRQDVGRLCCFHFCLPHLKPSLVVVLRFYCPTSGHLQASSTLHTLDTQHVCLVSQTAPSASPCSLLREYPRLFVIRCERPEDGAGYGQAAWKALSESNHDHIKGARRECHEKLVNTKMESGQSRDDLGFILGKCRDEIPRPPLRKGANGSRRVVQRHHPLSLSHRICKGYTHTRDTSGGAFG